MSNFMVSKNVQDFFDKNIDKYKRFFVIGETSSGKSSNTLFYFINKQYNHIIYITSKVVEIQQKANDIIKFCPENNYKIKEHIGNEKPKTELIGDTERNLQIDLFSYNKALYYFLNKSYDIKNNIFKNKKIDQPKYEKEIIILDEVDGIESSKEIELLIALLNKENKDSTIIYVSAVVNFKSIEKYKDFFMVKDKSQILELESIDKTISYKFEHITSFTTKLIKEKIFNVLENKNKYGQTIFIVPSISKIKELSKTDFGKINFGYSYKKNEDIIKKMESLKIKASVIECFKTMKDLIKDDEFNTETINYGIGCIFANLPAEYKNMIITMFNYGIINLLISTQLIKEGTDIKNADSMFLFEIKISKNKKMWSDSEISNFSGRIKRKGNTKNNYGNFCLISKERTQYNFSKILLRDNNFKSVLDEKTKIFYDFATELNKFFMNPIKNIEEANKAYNITKTLSDGLFFSLDSDLIYRKRKEIENFLIDYKSFSEKYSLDFSDNYFKKIKARLKYSIQNIQKENLALYLYFETMKQISQSKVDKNKSEFVEFEKRRIKNIFELISEINEPSKIKIRKSGLATELKNEYSNIEKLLKKEKIETKLF